MFISHKLLHCHAFYNFSEEVARGTGLIDKVTSDKRSLAQMHLSEYSDRDSGNYMDECKYDQYWNVLNLQTLNNINAHLLRLNVMCMHSFFFFFLLFSFFLFFTFLSSFHLRGSFKNIYVVKIHKQVIWNCTWLELRISAIHTW